MVDVGYSPLVYYWIVEYKDGTAIAQFDPESGIEILWKTVPKDNIVKASFAEFSQELSATITLGCGVSTISSMMPTLYSVDLDDTDTLMLLRRNYITYSGAGLQNRRTEYILGKNDAIVYKL